MAPRIGLLVILAACSGESVSLRGPLDAHVRGDGLDVRHGPDRLRLQTVSCGTAAVTGARPEGTPDHARLQHGAVTEWWAVRPRGLEQGWTLDAPCPGTDTLDVDVTGGVISVDPDGAGATLAGSTGTRWRYAGLRAWDANGDVVPARMDARPGGLRIALATDTATWPVFVDPMLEPLEDGEQQLEASDAGASDAFGTTVATADVDGDGFDDLAVGAIEDAGGSVYLFYGGATGLDAATEQNVRASDGADHNTFGQALANAGDVDGDGFADLLASATNWEEVSDDGDT